MKIRIINFYYLFITFILFLFDYYSQKQFFKKFTTLQSILSKSKFALRKYDLYRIKDYSIRLYALLGGITRFMDGYKVGYTERCRLTLLGAFAPIYDDFIDITKTEISKLKLFIKDPEYYIPINLKEKTGYEIMHLLLEYLKEDLFRLFPIILKTHLMQIESQKQKNRSTSLKELAKITYSKGGYSALLCRYMLNNPVKQGEYQAWFQYGAFLQILDDLFDINSDLKNGLHTIPNSIVDLKELDNIVDNQFNRFIDKTLILPYSYNEKKMIIYRIFMLYLVGKGMIYQLNKAKRKMEKTLNFAIMKKKNLTYKFFSFSNIIYIIKIVIGFKIEK